jgi:uncharacterized protein YdhG (YjbR/CyaY superfamily)
MKTGKAMSPTKTPENFEEYKNQFPENIRKKLDQLRNIIKKAAPEATEKISYGMPAFTLNGMLIYFAAHTSHMGFYPLTTGIIAFREELAPYKTSKGTVQFPYSEPLPSALITKIVKFRVLENMHKAAEKSKSKKATR